MNFNKYIIEYAFPLNILLQLFFNQKYKKIINKINFIKLKFTNNAKIDNLL